MIRPTALLTALLVLRSDAASALTILVPTDQPTIQAGLAAASAGDTVLVACGSYAEGTISMKSGVCLRGATGSAECVLLTGGAPILHCDGVDAATAIEGFTFSAGVPAVVCVNQSRPSFSDCRFVDNAATEGGAVFLEYSYPEFARCHFAGNSASVRGACVFYQGNNDANLSGPLRFHECAFQENHSPGAAVLYAGWWRGPSVDFDDCVFTANSSSGSSLLATSTSELGHRSLHVDACSFSENSVSGALISTFGYDPQIAACTVANNTGGHFIEVTSIPPLGVSSCTIVNTIIAFNSLTTAVSCDYAQTVVSCSDIVGNGGGDWTDCIVGQETSNANLSVDPRFCFAANPIEPLSLHSDSPCAAENNPACGLIGRWGVGCVVTATAARSWSAIKALY